jgi:hypothetical protein
VRIPCFQPDRLLHIYYQQYNTRLNCFFCSGPFKFIEETYKVGIPRLQYNPYTWTKLASILFVDWPVGAGFSFSRNQRGYNDGLGDIPATQQLRKFLTKVSAALLIVLTDTKHFRVY